MAGCVILVAGAVCLSGAVGLIRLAVYMPSSSLFELESSPRCHCHHRYYYYIIAMLSRLLSFSVCLVLIRNTVINVALVTRIVTACGILKCDAITIIITVDVVPVLVQGFLAEGLQRTSAGLGSVIIDSQPLSVALLAALLFGEKLTSASYVGLGLGVLGLSLLEVPVDMLTTLPQQALGEPFPAKFTQQHCVRL